MFPSLRPDQYQVLNKYPSTNQKAEQKAASLKWKREHYTPGALTKKQKKQLKLKKDWEALSKKARRHLDRQRLEQDEKQRESLRAKFSKKQANLRKLRAKEYLSKLDWLNATADHLRANQTSYEKRLGKEIKSLGFQPQVVLYVYIADFYHERLKIIVEADGSHHYNDHKQVDSDRIRDRYLRAKGFKVLRFPNTRIFQDLNSCVSAVRDEINKAKLVPPFAQAHPASL